MKLIEREIVIPRKNKQEDLLKYFEKEITENLKDQELPLRFVITKTDSQHYYCEIGTLIESNIGDKNIFEFKKRKLENNNKFNAVLVIPTGIGAEIGGHSGDAGPVAILLASACDCLITHPNVVNASDINELPENGLYVEGSIISRLLMGTIGLQKVRSNKVILLADQLGDTTNDVINMVSAARATSGFNCPKVITMEDSFVAGSIYTNSGRAVGKINKLDKLYKILLENKGDYDAVALATFINIKEDLQEEYYKSGGKIINPWGGVEAMLTHFVSTALDLPSAHSPLIPYQDYDVGIIDPRIAAEVVSITFLFCILKGLHRSPKIIKNIENFNNQGILSAADISCLVIPDGCVGLPTLAALEQGIPVIAVKENKNLMKNRLTDFPFAPGKLFIVENYWEAVGIMKALRAGIEPASVRRPLALTKVTEYKKENNN